MKKFFSLLATLLVLALAIWIGRTLWVHYMDELLNLLNPSVLKVEKLDSGVLPPAELVRRVEATEGKQVAMLWVGVDRDRKSTRLNSSHYQQSRMPSSA